MPPLFSPISITRFISAAGKYAIGTLWFLALFFAGSSYAQTPGPADTIKYTNGLTFCSGGQTTLSLNLPTPPQTFTYTWEKATSQNGPWTTLVTTSTLAVGQSGWYKVSLNINGTITPYDSVEVVVHDNPTASYSFSPVGQCANIPVAFTNNSTGTGLTYKWTFGDGNTSTATNPSHQFVPAVGNGNQSFNIKLVTTSDVGCKDSTTQVVNVKQLPSTALNGSNPIDYQGKRFFRNCTGGSSSTFTFVNNSSTSNTNYRIIWGDGSPDFNATTFTTLNHDYSLGIHHLKFIVTGTNGCTNTTEYGAFVGTNPAIGLGNPGNTTICTGSSLTFPINTTENNPPGTTYEVAINDGSPIQYFSHPPPINFTHLFTKTSCGTASGLQNHSFSATITARNPCDNSLATIVPIRVSEKPKAEIKVTPSDTVCINTDVTITSVNGLGSWVSSAGCDSGKVIWNIAPSTGYTIVSGSLGNDFGLADPSLWNSGTVNVGLRFTVTGKYTLRLRIANPVCGFDEITKIICVNPTPVANFTLDKTQGCAPMVVNATSTSNAPLCGNTTYNWSVTYASLSGCVPGSSNYTLLNGTTLQSANPQFQFNNPGKYTISLVTSFGAGCSSAMVTKDVTVWAKPSGTISFTPTICQNQSITPTAAFNTCSMAGSVQYSWSFPGGNPSSSNQASPGNVIYNATGNYTVSLTVTNSCGTTTVSQTLQVNPIPDITVPANVSVCAGQVVGPFTFSSSLPSTSFTWTNNQPSIGLVSSGSGSSIPAFTTKNTGTLPVAATITVTPNAGCAGPSKSFTITVNPIPLAPGVTNVNYCAGDAATPLTATAANGHTLNWYMASSGGAASSNAPTPPTNTPGTTTWYVSQTNTSTGCEGPRAAITVTVKQVPTFTTSFSNPTSCATATGSITLSGLAANISYSITYTFNGSPKSITLTSNTSGILTLNNLAAGVYDQIRVTEGATCPSQPSGPVSLSDPNPPATPVAGNNGPVCSGQSLQLNASSSTAEATYQWAGPNGFSSTAQNPFISNAQVAASGTYSVTATLNSCVSAAATTEVTVKPTPVLTATSNTPICENAGLQLTGTANPANTAVSWVGPNGFSNSNLSPAIANATLAAAGTYTLSGSLNGCDALPQSVAVVVNLNPVISNTVAGQPIGCLSNDGSITIEGNFTAGQGYTVTYLFNNTATTKLVTAQPNGSLLLNNLAPGSYTNILVIQNGCTSNKGTDITLVVPNPPATPTAGSNAPICAGQNLELKAESATAGVTYKWTGPNGFTSNQQNPVISNASTANSGSYTVIAVLNGCNSVPVSIQAGVTQGAIINAGPNQQLCNATTAQLAATNPGIGTAQWKQITGTAVTITNPTSATTNLNNLTPGLYTFVWEITNGVCGTGTDTVSIENLPPIANNVITPASTTLCNGQNVTLATSAGGATGSLVFKWQRSTDNINWTDIAGGNTTSITVAPTTSTYYRSIVTSGACTDISQAAVINVQPAITNNTIAASQKICINTAPALITGSVPAGGGAGIKYQWEQSTNGGASWQTITSATAANYQPGVLSANTSYRRLATTDLCAGPQTNTSNVVSITMQPNAHTAVSAKTPIACAPFTLTAANIATTHDVATNGTYSWYVNDTLIGTGLQFPGYTISSSGQTVVVKVVVQSNYGCLPDSSMVNISTISNPAPTFTLSDTVGCGPLDITITNTTPNAASFSYQWNFGNGQTSTAAQPGNILFGINPNRGDTIYTVTMRATAGCETFTVTQKIRVRARPRTLFTPNRSIGCSPMAVTFNNNSAGSNATFIWDFGDGSAPIVSSAASLSHTFYTAVLDTFRVRLFGTNDCGTDTAVFDIVVNPNRIKLDMAVNGSQLNGCVPHTVKFINNSTGANLFTWNFGDGTPPLQTTKGFDTVVHTYTSPGNFKAEVLATNGCSDTSTFEMIKVVQGPKVSFTAVPAQLCLGDTVYLNNTTTESLAWQWQFGDGSGSQVFQPGKHVYKNAGIYNLVLKGTKIFPEGFGCTDSAVATVAVASPTGNFVYRGGNYCEKQQVQLEVLNSNGSLFTFYPGNGDSIVSTAPKVAYQYPMPGKFVPSVKIIANTCRMYLVGNDTIFVDRIRPGFTVASSQVCELTTLRFTDTSTVFLGKQSVHWNWGDGTTSNTANAVKTYTQSGSYQVIQRITGLSGCEDSVSQLIQVVVEPVPDIAIDADSVACTGQPFTMQGSNTAGLPLTYQWTFGNNNQATGANVTTQFFTTGMVNIRLIGRTTFGCADTAFKTIRVRQSPLVNAGPDATICLGQTTRLTASGAANYVWSPQQALSCFTCTQPVASPTTTTSYVVNGTNAAGCTVADTVVITVMQPFKIGVSPNDTICYPQNESAQLHATGAFSYNWRPAKGLSSTTSSQPIARPATTTTYTVVGFDGKNCFTDTAFVTVAVGAQLPTVDLGSGSLVTAGTRVPLNPVITNGPIKRYTWTPDKDLSCNNCAQPVATINNNTIFKLEIETIYGCLAADTIQYQVLCQPNEQVYVPNAFSPDGDGINDVLMVRGKGLSMVKSFVVFNRWGQVVFEAHNFKPNEASSGWNGVMKNTGTKAAQDVYVYRVESECTAGGTFVHTGNVTLFYMR